MSTEDKTPYRTAAEIAEDMPKPRWQLPKVPEVPWWAKRIPLPVVTALTMGVVYDQWAKFEGHQGLLVSVLALLSLASIITIASTFIKADSDGW